MADRFVRSAVIALLALAATPASARTHRHTSSTHHATSKRSTAHSSSRHGGHATKGKTREDRHAASPAGVTSVPAGGLKVYCPARRSPLLIRKATQGSGTTVTVVCR